MDYMDKAAAQAVQNCVKVQRGENVVIITDREAEKIGGSIGYAALDVGVYDLEFFIMEDFGERPEDGSKPLKFPEEIAWALGDADVSFYCANTKDGEYESFREPMFKIIENSKIRHAHMPGIDETLMRTGMLTDYKVVQEVSKRVYERVKDASSIRVTSPAGTDITVKVGAYKWAICDGVITPEHWTNLPDGEVFTCAEDMEGIAVIDGVLGDYFDRRYGLLDKNPVIWEIRDCRVKKISCDKKEIVSDLEEYMAKDDNANRIGEFALGTNVGLEGFVGNMLQDEKFPGVHMAIGDPIGEDTGATWESTVHCDAVMKDCTVIVDGYKIMEDGKYIPEILP